MAPVASGESGVYSLAAMIQPLIDVRQFTGQRRTAGKLAGLKWALPDAADPTCRDSRHLSPFVVTCLRAEQARMIRKVEPPHHQAARKRVRDLVLR
ncbi:MAG TPA: hypothetical protein DEP84_33645 [Chloroflexi bacterium]|nr:hypothetical protein [Chloroflexota bacterium]